jgi:hypothetical protein
MTTMMEDEFRLMLDARIDAAVDAALQRRFSRPSVAKPQRPAMPSRPLPSRPVLVSSHGVGVGPASALRAGWRPGGKPPKAPKNPKDDYRGMRKYTAKKLATYLDEEFLPSLRARIGRGDDGTVLAAWELLNYIEAVEGDMPDWKAKRQPPADGVPRKRGRPTKAERAARAAKSAAA